MPDTFVNFGAITQPTERLLIREDTPVNTTFLGANWYQATDNSIACTLGAAIWNHANGLPYDSIGRLCVDIGGGTPMFWLHGLAISAAGRLMLSTNPISHYIAGWPVDSAGRIVSLTALPGTSFDLPLTISLVPGSSTGSGTPTFTRATTAYVTDWEGVLRQAVAGEARFTGARRVRNLITGSSENLSNAAWTLALAALTSGVSDPVGGVSATTITASGSAVAYNAMTSGFVVGDTLVNSAWIRRRSGSGTIVFRTANNVDVDITAQVTATWARFSVSAVISSGTAFLVFGLGGAGNAIDVWYPQCEVVTAQSNQAPSEYVSVGVLAAPYHGAGVDGVKYFSTQNGNSVSGNVVSPTVTGRTNTCLQSQTFGTTWIADGVTVVADNTAAPDGTMTADKLLETAANVEHRTYQGILNPPAVPTTVSVYLKYLGRQWAAVRFWPSDEYAYFDIVNGVVGNISTSYISSTITSVGNGWFRCSATLTPPVVLTYVVVGGSPINGLGSGPNVFVGDITKGVYIWGAQVEVGSVATAYIPTTTAPVSVQSGYIPGPAIPVLGSTVRTNLFLYSNQFNQHPTWYEGGTGLPLVISPASDLDPVGGNDAWSVTRAAASSMVQNYNFPAAGSYVMSIWARKPTGAPPTMFQIAGGFTETLTEQWQRYFTVKVVPSAGVSQCTYSLLTGGVIYEFYGAQLELGTAPTAYIPTTTAAVSVPAPRSNIVLQSQALGTAPWINFLAPTVVNNAGVAPDGTNTATSIESTTTQAQGRMQTLASAATPYAMSAYFKAVSGNNNVQFGIFAGPVDAFIQFNCATGAILYSGADQASVAITSVGNGWFRVQGVPTPSINPQIVISTLGVAPCKFLVWGVQMEPGTAVTAYIPTTTAAVSVSTVSPGLLGYLSEGQRTNLLPYSQDFVTAWVKNGTTSTANVTTAPDGTATASRFLETVANAEHTIYQGPTVVAAAHTFSVYAKYLGRQWIHLRLDNTAPVLITFFDILNGVVGVVAPGTTATITAVGGGWYRCSVTVTTTAATWYALVGSAIADATSTIFVGDITKGAYLWGAQLEAAAFASSYIPTVAASVTRNADSLTYPLAGNFNNTVGSLYVESFYKAVDNTARIIGDGANAPPAPAYWANSYGGSYGSYDGTGGIETIAGFPSNVVNKSATAWGANLRVTANGSAVTTGTFDGSYLLTSIGIGVGASIPWYGNIRNVKIYPTALTDAQLQYLTSP